MEKLKDSAEKALILRDSLVKNADGWRFNRRMNSIVSVRSISGATTKAMKNLVLGCLKEKSLILDYYVMGQTISKVKNQLRRLRVT